MSVTKEEKMIYTVAMTPREEEVLTFRRRARYFVCVLLIYVAVYFVMYLCLSLLHALVYLSPYFRIFMLLLFFIAASAVTNRLIRTKTMRSFIEL